MKSISKYKKVGIKVASLYKDPTFKSELVTQALLNEELLVLDRIKNWYKVRQWDNYESWIHSFYLYKSEEPIFHESIECNSYNLLEIAKSYLNTPYLWGGKSKLGFDCSCFIQTVYKQLGVFFPRDTSEQIKSKNLVEIKYSNINLGDLLFFANNKVINHVAIYISNGDMIHASGKVKIEKLEENIKLFNSLYKIFSIRDMVQD